jgi:hypothetical protein
MCFRRELELSSLRCLTSGWGKFIMVSGVSISCFVWFSADFILEKYKAWVKELLTRK